jgi:hypothetical protein
VAAISPLILDHAPSCPADSTKLAHVHYKETCKAYSRTTTENPAVEIAISPAEFSASSNAVLIPQFLSKLLEKIVMRLLARSNEPRFGDTGAVD